MKKLIAAVAALFATAAVMVGLSSSPAAAVATVNYVGPGAIYTSPTSNPLPHTRDHAAWSYESDAAASAVVSLTPGVCSASLSQVTFTHVGTCELKFSFPAVTKVKHGVTFSFPADVGYVSIPVLQR